MELFTRKVVKRTLHFHLIDKADNATNILSVDVNRNAGTRERAIPTDTTAHQGTVNTLCVLSLILVLVGLVSISIGGGYLVLLGMLMGIAGMIQAGVRGQRGEGFALVAVLLPIALLLLLLIILKDQHWS